MKVYNIPQLTNLYYDKCPELQFWTIDQNTLFISGGMNAMAEVMNNCYMFKISANEFERKENMNKPRATHGL